MQYPYDLIDYDGREVTYYRCSTKSCRQSNFLFYIANNVDIYNSPVWIKNSDSDLDAVLSLLKQIHKFVNTLLAHGAKLVQLYVTNEIGLGLEFDLVDVPKSLFRYCPRVDDSLFINIGLLKSNDSKITYSQIRIVDNNVNPNIRITTVGTSWTYTLYTKSDHSSTLLYYLFKLVKNKTAGMYVTIENFFTVPCSCLNNRHLLNNTKFVIASCMELAIFEKKRVFDTGVPCAIRHIYTLLFYMCSI